MVCFKYYVQQLEVVDLGFFTGHVRIQDSELSVLLLGTPHITTPQSRFFCETDRAYGEHLLLE